MKIQMHSHTLCYYKITETSVCINHMRRVTLYCHVARNNNIHFSTGQYKHAWGSRGGKLSKSLALCLVPIL